MALIVGHLRRSAEASGAEVKRVVAGRPVRFVAEGGEQEDDFATGRLVQAFAKAGIDEVVFEYEPSPAWVYTKLERWHHVSFLNAPQTLRLLRDLQRHVEHPERVEQLLG